MLMAGADGTFSAHRLFQRKHDGNAPEAHQRHIAKIVHVGPEACLGVQILRHEPVGAVERVRRRGSMRGQVGLHAMDRALHRGSAGIQGVHEFAAMQLLVARDNRIHHGNSDAATDIAQQVIEAAGVANLLILEERHGSCGQRDKYAA